MSRADRLPIGGKVKKMNVMNELAMDNPYDKQ